MPDQDIRARVREAVASRIAALDGPLFPTVEAIGAEVRQALDDLHVWPPPPKVHFHALPSSEAARSGRILELEMFPWLLTMKPTDEGPVFFGHYCSGITCKECGGTSVSPQRWEELLGSLIHE